MTNFPKPADENVLSLLDDSREALLELAEEMKISKEEIDELLSCELRSITVSLQGTVKSKSDL